MKRFLFPATVESRTDQVYKQLQDMITNPPDRVKIFMGKSSAARIVARVKGYPNTPYENGYFNVHLNISPYPKKMPIIHFLTPIWHPMINKKTGHVNRILVFCDNEPFKPLRNIMKFVANVFNQINIPTQCDFISNKLADMFLKAGMREKFLQRARDYTLIHAIPLAERFPECQFKEYVYSDSEEVTPTSPEHITELDRLEDREFERPIRCLDFKN